MTNIVRHNHLRFPKFLVDWKLLTNLTKFCALITKIDMKKSRVEHFIPKIRFSFFENFVFPPKVHFYSSD